MPVEVFEMSFEQVVDLLEQMGDISAEAIPLPVLWIARDDDAVHYKMAWPNEPHLGGNYWRAPTTDVVRLWLADNAPSSEFHDLSEVNFETCDARDRFMRHLPPTSGGGLTTHLKLHYSPQTR